MGNFKLSLPTDIPWRRICVSRDMLDPIPCDDKRPQRWRSSLVVFRYDPAPEYQPYENEIVSYIKVVATIGPFQHEEIGIDVPHPFVPPELIDQVEESFPCYGAVLQVAVTPTNAERDAYELEQYPYFIDFEPKKRELFEAVTQTGELLSGSMSNLSVGKAATDTHSLEDYNLDMGGSGSFGLSAAVGPYSGSLSASWDDREQTGTVSRSTHEVSNVRTTDFSTERRERESHTTQLTQMYNLFQAFHLGTNRALFLIEPRPHVRQIEPTFINGPRVIEGIQEVFLVVVRPKAMKDFCIGVLLETAHLTFEPAPLTSMEMRHLLAVGVHTISSSDKVDDVVEEGHAVIDYEPPAGWEIDLSQGKGGYSFIFQNEVNVGETVQVNVTANSLHVDATVPSTGKIEMDVIIYLKTKENFPDAKVHKLFLSARELCCCPIEPVQVADVPWTIVYAFDLSSYNWQVLSGAMTPKAFFESRQIAAVLHKEIVRSFASSRRLPRGVLSYLDSDLFHVRAASALRLSRFSSKLEVPLGETPYFETAAVEKLSRSLGIATVGELLATDAIQIGRVLGLDLAQIGGIKTKILRSITENEPEKTPTAART